MQAYQGYGFQDATASHLHGILAPAVLRFADSFPPGAHVLDLGCGNGALCGKFLSRGFDVTGVDPSASGIAQARKAHPAGKFHVGFVDAQLPDAFGRASFDMLVSTDVIEHVYAPRTFIGVCHDLLRPGGLLVLSTPYHGYLKNLAISLAGHWDSHANSLWDGGHMKLWSKKTLTALLREAGFEAPAFHGLGRIPFLWMSMILAARRPGTGV